MALTSGAKKFFGILVVGGILAGVGVYMNKHKAAIKVPATTQEAVQTPAPVAVPEVPKTIVQTDDIKTTPVKEAAPAKKHTAGHVAKHAQEKHQHSTKSTHTLSGSTHIQKPVSDADALKELSKQGGF